MTNDGGRISSYTLEEWINREAASYADYLRAMSGDHLVEEYHRQGGEDIVYYDPSSDRIVDNAGGVDGCPTCHARMVGRTDISSGGTLTSTCWCMACGYSHSQSINPLGRGSGGESQLSQAELTQFKAEREARFDRDGAHWRGIIRRRDEVGRDS